MAHTVFTSGTTIASSWLNDVDALTYSTGRSQVLTSITALKAVLKTTLQPYVDLTGYYASGDGGGGLYYYDSSDTTSSDNGGTIIVATDGGRWKLVHTGTVSVKQFGAKGDGSTSDYAAIQAAINSGLRRLYFPSGRYKCLTCLNITNLGVTGVPLKLFGDAPQYNDGTLTAGSVILSNPGNGGQIADLTGSQFVIMEDLMFLSTGANSALHGLLYARSTLSGFAQNNSLRRVIVKMDGQGGGSVALQNNCAEQFVCDECWLESDIPYITTLANEQSWTSTYATIANTTFSNTTQTFRATTFSALTSTSMILQGLGASHFDNCIWIPVAGNVYAHGITLRSSAQAYMDCQSIRFTGQIEAFPYAIRMEGVTRDLEFDFTTSNVTTAHFSLVAGTVHYSPKFRTNPYNSTAINMLSASGATVTIYGGNITLAPNMKLIDTNLKLLGTDVDGGNVNLSLAAGLFSVNSASSYHARWTNSKLYGTVTWNPGTVNSAATNATTFALTGVAFPSAVQVLPPYAMQGCTPFGSVDSAGNIKLTIANLTGSNVTFGSGSWRVIVEAATF